MNPILLHIVLMIVMRELAQVKSAIDWPALRTTVDLQVRALVPGTWFDQDAVDATNALLDGCQTVLGDEAAIEALLTDVAEQKWQEAVDELKTLLAEGWQPTSGAGRAVLPHLAVA